MATEKDMSIRIGIPAEQDDLRRNLPADIIVENFWEGGQEMISLEPMLHEDRDVLVFTSSQMAHRERRAVLFLAGFVVGMVTVAVAHGIQKPSAPSSMTLLNLFLSGIAGGIVTALFKRSAGWHELWITSPILGFRNSSDRVDVPTDAVRIVLGLAGFQFDGGEILVWKHVLVATEDRTFFIKLHSKDCPVCFEVLSQVCSKALFIDHKWNVYAPANPAPTIEPGQIVSVLRSVARKNTFHYIAVGATLTVVSSGIIVAIATYMYEHPNSSQVIVYAIVTLVAGLLALGHGLRSYLAHRSVIRTIRRIEQER